MEGPVTSVKPRAQKLAESSYSPQLFSVNYSDKNAAITAGNCMFTTTLATAACCQGQHTTDIDFT